MIYQGDPLLILTLQRPEIPYEKFLTCTFHYSFRFFDQGFK